MSRLSVLLVMIVLFVASVACGDETPTSERLDVQGFTRSNPMPISQSVATQNWNVRVLEVVRGDSALEMILDANSYNEPPGEGNEYVLVRIEVTCTYDDSDSHLISAGDFYITGNNLVLYDPASVVEPEPNLYTELFSGGETIGWVSFMIAEGEQDLILVFDELMDLGTNDRRFISLE